MSITEEQLAAAAVAPRVSREQVDSSIKETKYIQDGTLTICIATMQNGFKLKGFSACASPENYDKSIGEKLSLDDAKKDVWDLLGYELRSKLNLIEEAGEPTKEITRLGLVKTYIGTRVVHAVPMTRGMYNELRGWGVPSDENPHDTGYLVQHTGESASNVEGFAGYISWMPTTTFEETYATGTVIKKTSYVDRLIKEVEDLSDKVSKLSVFTYSASFESLPNDSKSDLREQLAYMEGYLEIVKRRIDKATT